MPHAISMPKLGMSMEEGTIISWPLEIGASVEKGEVILVIESEKTEVDVEALVGGFFRHIYVEVGEVVPCGSLLGAITDTADEAFDADTFFESENRPEVKSGGQLKVGAPPSLAKTPAPATESKTERKKLIAPAARAAAKKLGVDPHEIEGTGPGGRVTKEDVETWAAARENLVPVGGGVSLEVLTDGEGESVVLLPGFGTDISAFARQTPILAEHFHVLGVNPRGVGLSDAPRTEIYDIAQTAADAAACFDGPAHVVGASLGSAAALELAVAHPNRVKTLTLITPFIEQSPRLRVVADAWTQMAAELSVETLAAALLPWFFSSAFLSDESVRARTARGLAQTLSRTPADSLRRIAAGMAAWSGTRADTLSEITIPTLVISAGEDLLTPNADAVAQAIPGAKLLAVEGAGHAVALESADAVNEALLAHLA